MKHRVAITGGIGSGKSYVCQLLKQQGIDIYDCDQAAKRLMHTSQQLRQELTSLIGPDTFINNVLNKAAVAHFLLTSPQNAEAINAIVHPAVANDFIQSGMEWMECAILYESGFDRLVDTVIVVTAPEDVRIRRITHRDGIGSAKAKEWMSRQWPQEEVQRRADFEIRNDGQQPLLPQIEIILQQLKESCNKLF